MGGEGCVGGKRCPNPEGRFIINQAFGTKDEDEGKSRKVEMKREERRRQEGMSQGLALLLLEKEKGGDCEESVFQTVCECHGLDACV